MKEIVYPRKLDVPSTQGTIFDLHGFFCSMRQNRSIAKSEMEQCVRMNRN